MRREFAAGNLTYQLRRKLENSGSDCVIQLAIARSDAALTPVIAVGIHAIMASPRAAIRNRMREFEHQYAFIRQHHQDTVVAGVLVLNAQSHQAPSLVQRTRSGAKSFDHSLRFCVEQFRNVTTNGRFHSQGMHAKALIVLDLPLREEDDAFYLVTPPAPQPGDPLHYDSFIRKLCEEYSTRFGR